MRSSPAPRSRSPAASVGYFVVLRAQVFAGDALSHVAFTGVLAAALAGIDLRIGLFAATIAVALISSPRSATDPRRRRGDRRRVRLGARARRAVPLPLQRGSGGSNGVLAARTLFGSIFSLRPATRRSRR